MTGNKRRGRKERSQQQSCNRVLPKMSTLKISTPKNFIYFDKMHMWQSCVEIKGYSVAYFDRIAAFEVLYH